jgi:hypothetical protein
MTNTRAQQHSTLARRFVEMGLSSAPPTFPPGGISLVQLVPWRRLWPWDPRHNHLERFGAAVFPAVAGGFIALKPQATVGQAVLAAMLPIHEPATAVAALLVADDVRQSPFQDRFVFVLSNGEPHDDESVRRQIAGLADDGVSMVGLGLGPDTMRMQESFPVSRANLAAIELPGALATLLVQSLRRQ